MIVYTTMEQYIGLREALLRAPEMDYAIKKSWLGWQGVREVQPYQTYEIVVDEKRALTGNPVFSKTPFSTSDATEGGGKNG